MEIANFTELSRRREYSHENILKLKSGLEEATASSLSSEAPLDNASIYATGSFGRLEASEGSDLDAFVVGCPLAGRDDQELSRLDQKVLIGRVIEVARNLSFPEFDGDGEYIRYYSAGELNKNIGTPQDEIQNTFTARLLRLLESAPIGSPEVHHRVLDNVIDLYWRDYDDWSSSFRPTFLINDILKYWRLLCVDYEAKMTIDHDGHEERKRQRRVKNLKLRYNRIMTCFSTIAALCNEYTLNGTIDKNTARAICEKCPLERLLSIARTSSDASVTDRVEKILSGYSRFLELAALGKPQLVEKLEKASVFNAERATANEFGTDFYELVRLRSQESDLFRYLVI